MATAKWDGSRWRLRVTENGKTRSFSSTTPGRKGRAEVEEKARKYGRLTSLATFGDAWERYLEELGFVSGPEHVQNTESIGRLYLLPTLEREKVVDLRPYDYEHIIFHLKKRDGSPMAKKSLQNIRATIINFNKFCVRAGLLETPVTEIRIPKDAPKVGKVILQPDQAKRLFHEFEDEWYINLWRWMLATGCRPGEAFGLKWSDIRDGLVHIERAYNYRGRMTEGKNRNARRCFALNSVLEGILNDQKNKTWRLNSEFVFCNHAGKVARQTDAIHSWDRIASTLGTSASPYSLRHTFISYMSHSVPEGALKELVGHSTSMDTYGVYGHVVNGDLERTAEQVNITLLNRIAPTLPQDNR